MPSLVSCNIRDSSLNTTTDYRNFSLNMVTSKLLIRHKGEVSITKSPAASFPRIV